MARGQALASCRSVVATRPVAPARSHHLNERTRLRRTRCRKTWGDDRVVGDLVPRRRARFGHDRGRVHPSRCPGVPGHVGDASERSCRVFVPRDRRTRSRHGCVDGRVPSTVADDRGKRCFGSLRSGSSASHPRARSCAARGPSGAHGRARQTDRSLVDGRPARRRQDHGGPPRPGRGLPPRRESWRWAAASPGSTPPWAPVGARAQRGVLRGASTLCSPPSRAPPGHGASRKRSQRPAAPASSPRSR